MLLSVVFTADARAVPDQFGQAVADCLRFYVGLRVDRRVFEDAAG